MILPPWLFALPWGAIVKVAGVVLVIAGVLAWDHKRISAAEARGATLERAIYTERDRLAAEKAAADTERMRVTAKEIQREADQENARRLADAAAGRVERDRLRAALAAFAARPWPHPGPVAHGSPAGDPIGVLADLLSRADTRAGILAEFADAAHAAGKQCQRAYEALTPQ